MSDEERKESASPEPRETESAPAAQPIAEQPAHPPIPGMRAMAIVRWVLLGLVVILAAGTWWRFVLMEGPTADGRPDRYYCPMHPQIRSPDPGTCPICYMTLEPIPERGSQPASHADAAVPEIVDNAALGPVMLTTERQQRAGISTMPVERLAIEEPFRWPASVEALEGARAEVRVRSEAFVERIAVRESNVTVRRDQPLAWVYSPDIVAAQEELLVARRWRTAGTGQPGQPDLSAAEGAIEERLRLLGVSSADIERTLATGRAQRTIALRAPISGHVTQLNAVVGTYAMPSVLLYEITDFTRMRVVATPFAEDLSWLQPGTPAVFSPRTRPNEEVPVTLELVEPGVSQDTRALRVRFSTTGANFPLRPGEIGEVAIQRPPREMLVVPRDAVIDTGTRRYVFVQRPGGIFEPRPVEIGGLHEEHRIVTSGVTVGELVVARGAFVLDSESRLQAALAPAPDAGTAAAPPDHAEHGRTP